MPLLDTILNATPDGLIAIDTNYTVTFVNSAAETLLHTTRDDLLGKPLNQASIHAHLRDQLLLAVAACHSEQSTPCYATLDDTCVLFVKVSPFTDDSSQGWVIQLQDVTVQRQAELSRAKFLYTAGHDMRNPLSISLSSLITLGKMLKDRDAATDEVFQLAMGGIERLQMILEDVLQLEYIETGYNFRCREFHILDVLHEIQKESESTFIQKAVTLEVSVAPDIPLLQADVRLFKRAIHSYLENAIKLTPSGGRVILTLHAQGDQLIVEVQDSGEAISDDAHARIFERFYRMSGDKSAGSGLTFAIVKAIAQAHGGDVYIRSVAGNGNIFGFRVPVNPAEELKRDIRLTENAPDSKPMPKLFS
jgi:PAS domain S-box-containing protein